MILLIVVGLVLLAGVVAFAIGAFILNLFDGEVDGEYKEES